MGYREVSVVEIREVLRRWVHGEGLRGIDRNTGVDRKTVRRYVEAAVASGVVVVACCTQPSGTTAWPLGRRAPRRKNSAKRP